MFPPEHEAKEPPDGVASIPSSDATPERAMFRQIGEREKFAGDRLRVVIGTFVGPDGFTFEREMVRTFDAVCVVPLKDDRREVLAVSQYRGAVGRPLLELPAGKLDIPGEAPETCAERELLEEVGVHAERVVELGQFFNSPGYADEHMVCFLAEGLRPGERTADGVEEENLVVETIVLADFEDMIASGEIVDAKTIVGLYLARSYLERERGDTPASS
jgi:ADP-ribose pyrophosphatase